METRRTPGVIRIRKNQDRISMAAVFAFLIAVSLPFHTMTIAGVGILLLFGIPMLLCCIPMLQMSVRQKKWDKATVYLALFMLYNLVAYVWSPQFSMSSIYNNLKRMAVVMCLYSLRLNKCEQKLLLNGSVISCLIVCYFLQTGTNTTYYEGRALLSVFGISQDANYLGFVFLIPMAIAMQMVLKKRNLLTRAWGAVIAILILYCVMLTGSRGAFVGIAAVVVVNVVSTFKTMGGKITFSVVMLLFVLVLFDYILLILPPEMAARFTIRDVVETRGTNRLDIWISVFKIVRSAPHMVLFGWGASSSQWLVGLATHNFILQLLLEVGIVGTVLFLGFVWLWFKRLFKRDTLCLSILLGCMAMAMTLSVNSIYYFWIPFTLSIVCSKARLPEDYRKSDIELA